MDLATLEEIKEALQLAGHSQEAAEPPPIETPIEFVHSPKHEKLAELDIRNLFRVMGQTVQEEDIDLLLQSCEGDFPEFIHHMAEVIGDPCPSESQLRRAFKVFDNKNRGFVSFGEMEYAVNKFMSRAESAEMGGRMRTTEVQRVASAGISVHELEDMFTVMQRKKKTMKKKQRKTGRSARPDQVGTQGESSVGQKSEEMMEEEEEGKEKEKEEGKEEVAEGEREGVAAEAAVRIITVEDFIDVMKIIF